MGSAGYVFNPCIIKKKYFTIIDAYEFSYKSKYGKLLSLNLFDFKVYFFLGLPLPQTTDLTLFNRRKLFLQRTVPETNSPLRTFERLQRSVSCQYLIQ